MSPPVTGRCQFRVSDEQRRCARTATADGFPRGGVRPVPGRSSLLQIRPQPKGHTMPDILHRISIDAPPQRVHELIASTDGIARWWTGRPLTGEHTIGSSFSVYFGDAEQPAAIMQVVTDAS